MPEAPAELGATQLSCPLCASAMRRSLPGAIPSNDKGPPRPAPRRAPACRGRRVGAARQQIAFYCGAIVNENGLLGPDIRSVSTEPNR